MVTVRPLFNNSYDFPPVSNATKEGLLAYGGDLNPKRLILGYQQGIFPWYDDKEPILWWSPDPRFILELDDFKISKSLRKTIKKNIFEIKYNTAFVEVINECAKSPRNGQVGTWIVSEMIEAYTELHRLGYAHSFEAWLDGELVGGGYGVALGDIFCGESMFAKVTDASKVSLVYLVERLQKKGFRIIDSQLHTNHLEKFGAKHISRDEYLIYLQESLNKSNQF